MKHQWLRLRSAVAITVLWTCAAFGAKNPEPSATACAGGTFVFFKPGTATLDRPAEEMLDGFLALDRAVPMPSVVHISSGGDQRGDRFNARLSRARSQRIARYLRKRGLDRSRISIKIDRYFTGVLGPGPDQDQQGWVVRLIKSEVAAQYNKPGMPIMECF